jgi:hypothetical protein
MVNFVGKPKGKPVLKDLFSCDTIKKYLKGAGREGID